MNRKRALMTAAIAVAAVALGWGLMTGLSRILETSAPPEPIDAPAQQTAPAPTAAVPRIKATLFFASAEGIGLVPVEQEVPLAQGTLAQARALIEAQLSATPPDSLISTIPQGTKLLGVYVSERNEAFVDLDSTVRTKHPGGSMNELYTVYTIVNTLTTNLQDVQNVQLLIDGREVDTLAGHVDLRHPLRKNENLNATK